MIGLDSLVATFKPWADFYGNSKVVSGVVTGVHIAALTFGGGLAIAADRMTLRALRGGADDKRRQLAEVHAIHRPVLIGLATLFVSGVMMATADLGTFLPSPVFWTKLALVTLLLVNGAVLMRTETALRSGGVGTTEAGALWGRLRATSWLSLALWASTLIAGITLSNIS